MNHMEAFHVLLYVVLLFRSNRSTATQDQDVWQPETNIKNVTKSEISQSIARAQEVDKLLEEPTQSHDRWQNYVIETRVELILFGDN